MFPTFPVPFVLMRKLEIGIRMVCCSVSDFSFYCWSLLIFRLGNSLLLQWAGMKLILQKTTFSVPDHNSLYETIDFFSLKTTSQIGYSQQLNNQTQLSSTLPLCCTQNVLRTFFKHRFDFWTMKMEILPKEKVCGRGKVFKVGQRFSNYFKTFTTLASLLNNRKKRSHWKKICKDRQSGCTFLVRSQRSTFLSDASNLNLFTNDLCVARFSSRAL